MGKSTDYWFQLQFFTPLKNFCAFPSTQQKNWFLLSFIQCMTIWSGLLQPLESVLRCSMPHLKRDLEGNWMVSTMIFRLLTLQRWILKWSETVQIKESIPLMVSSEENKFVKLLPTCELMPRSINLRTGSLCEQDKLHVT